LLSQEARHTAEAERIMLATLSELSIEIEGVLVRVDCLTHLFLRLRLLRRREG